LPFLTGAGGCNNADAIAKGLIVWLEVRAARSIAQKGGTCRSVLLYFAAVQGHTVVPPVVDTAAGMRGTRSRRFRAILQAVLSSDTCQRLTTPMITWPSTAAR
jgi:hypothetical protein